MTFALTEDDRSGQLLLIQYLGKLKCGQNANSDRYIYNRKDSHALQFDFDRHIGYCSRSTRAAKRINHFRFGCIGPCYLFKFIEHKKYFVSSLQ